MSRGRFGLLLGLLFAVVGGAAFLAVTLVLDSDDDEPASSTTTTTTVPLTTTTVELTTPTFVAVVRSQADEAGARATAAQLAEAGFTSGVLHSDDYSSLNPGFWVAYVGPYPDIGAADAAVNDLAGAGFPGAYPRCIGTDAECG